jgi:hypothetical protein
MNSLKILKQSLIFVLPALLAGYAAWIIIPCQLLRSIPVPKGTKLLEFSPGGHYVVTFKPQGGRLTLWHADSGKEAFASENLDIGPNDARSSYGFSADDQLLAVATGTPKDQRLVMVNLDSGNTQTPVTYLARCRPQPSFSSDGRYLSYFWWEYAVVFDIADKRECLLTTGFSSSLGPPTPQGKWLLREGRQIDCWDVSQKRREWTLPPWPSEHASVMSSLSPDEQAITGLAVVESRFPDQRVFHYRFDFGTQKMTEDWEYTFPPSAHVLWNLSSSNPVQFLLVKTLDDHGRLVQDLVDVYSGNILARYHEPIDMLEDIALHHRAQVLHHDAGLILTLGRQGEMVLDSQHRVIVSKMLTRDTIWWRNFGRQLRWLGLQQPPPQLHLQFHSAETGKLLERVPIHTPYKMFEPVLAMHPTEPLLAVIDEKENERHLQIWWAPPPKPWGWIIACSLGGGAVALLLRMGFGKLTRKMALFKKA